MQYPTVSERRPNFSFPLMTDKLNQETSWPGAPRLVMGFRMPPPRCLHVARTVVIQYSAEYMHEITVSDLNGRAFARHAVGICKRPPLLLLQAVAFCVYLPRGGRPSDPCEYSDAGIVYCGRPSGAYAEGIALSLTLALPLAWLARLSVPGEKTHL